MLHVREITQRRAPTFAVLWPADEFLTLNAGSECVSDENWCADDAQSEPTASETLRPVGDGMMIDSRYGIPQSESLAFCPLTGS